MLAERSVELLDVSAAGIILTDGNGGGLSVAAASSEASRLLELFVVAIDSGPCVDCIHSGGPVTVHDLDAGAARERWPRFATDALERGFRAVHALPMRHRGDVIGVLTLMHTGPHTLTEPDVRLGQALADAATVGLLHERAVRRAETVAEQFQHALNSRIIIEQAGPDRPARRHLHRRRLRCPAQPRPHQQPAHDRRVPRGGRRRHRRGDLRPHGLTAVRPWR